MSSGSSTPHKASIRNGETRSFLFFICSISFCNLPFSDTHGAFTAFLEVLTDVMIAEFILCVTTGKKSLTALLDAIMRCNIGHGSMGEMAARLCSLFCSETVVTVTDVWAAGHCVEFFGHRITKSLLGLDSSMHAWDGVWNVEHH